MEIHQQAALDAGESEVGENLRFVNRENLGDGLQLQQQLAIDDDIRLVSSVDSHPVVPDRQYDLPRNRETLPAI